MHRKALVALLALIPLAFAGVFTGLSAVPSPPSVKALAAKIGKLPISFEPNVGQMDAAIGFAARVAGGVFRLSAAKSVLSLAISGATVSGPTEPQRISDHCEVLQSVNSRVVANQAPQPASSMQSASLNINFLGANREVKMHGGTQLPGHVNYLLGADPSNWRTNVPTYSNVTYDDLYPGIALSYDGDTDQLKGTYDVAPYADPTTIRWQYESAAYVRINLNGDLEIGLNAQSDADPTAAEDILVVAEQAPVAWQDTAGWRVPVDVRYEIAADGSVGFVVGAYDHSAALIIDPVIRYSTFLGGSGFEYPYGMTLDSAGSVYVVGELDSPDFPTVSPVRPAYSGQRDAFISKLSPAGDELIFSTYLGGTGWDIANDITVDSDGNSIIVGFTQSSDFPLMNPYQGTKGASSDAFVTKLSPDGSQLLYSTFLGGSSSDDGLAIVVDSSGNAIVSGNTVSTDFPIQVPYQSAPAGGVDMFMAKFSADGSSLIYSTYLGGSSEDRVGGLTIDGLGNAYLTGGTRSSNYPVNNAYQSLYRGYFDVFLTKVSASGSQLLYSTYFGGTDTEFAQGITLDNSGNMYLAGASCSSDLPLRNPLQSTNNGYDDVFVAKLNAQGSELLYSTLLGGRWSDWAVGIGVDAAANMYLAGVTYSTNFPQLDPTQSFGGSYHEDSFAAAINASGSALIYSTYLGGSDQDDASDIVVDSAGAAYISGITYSTEFPVVAPRQSVLNGRGDTFIMKIDPSFPTPPSPPPAPLSNVDNGQQAPQVDGAIAVWEEYSDGSWNIRGQDLALELGLNVYPGPGDQRDPAVSGNLVVWQDNRNGDWDIYGARISDVGVSASFAVFVGPGDQVNPAVSRNIVVWQSTAPGSGRWDIEGSDINVGSSFTLSLAGNTSINPVVEVRQDGNAAVWQTTVATTTVQTVASGATWAVVGAQNITQANPDEFSVPPASGHQMNPSISDLRVVWQELVNTASPGASEDYYWRIKGYDVLNSIPFGVTFGPGDQTSPVISGNRVVYQDDSIEAADSVNTPDRHGRWTLSLRDLIRNTTNVVRSELPNQPLPDVSGARIVWQELIGSTSVSGLAEQQFDVFGNIGTVEPTSTTPTSTVSPTPSATPLSGFSDVHSGDYFYEPVRYLSSQGVISGYSDGTFRPYNNTTRGQLAKIVVLAEAFAIATPDAPTFADVPVGSTFFSFVETAVARDIISGYEVEERREFRAFNDVTRGQLSKIVVKAEGWELVVPAEQTFVDVSSNNPFYREIETAVAHGLISGYDVAGSREFRWGNNATRGQIAKIVYLAVAAGSLSKR